VVRVLFWVSLIMLFAKFGNLVSPMQLRPSRTHALNGGSVRLSQIAIGLFGANRVMFEAQDLAHLVHQPELRVGDYQLPPPVPRHFRLNHFCDLTALLHRL